MNTSAPALATPVAGGRRLILANTVALALAYAVPRSIHFLAAMVAARVLGAGGFGIYTTAGAVAVVASIVATLGMQPLLVREVARAPERAPELIAAAHTARFGTVALMALALATLPLLGVPADVWSGAVLLGIGYGIGAFVDNLGAYFQGIERMHVWTEANAVLGVVSGVAGILLVTTTRDPVWLCAAPIFGYASALLWLMRRAPAAVRWPGLAPLATVGILFRRLAPFAIAFIGTALYYRADILLLARWRSPAEVGVYGAAYRFLDVAQALAIAGAGALLPRLSRGGPRPRGSARSLLAAVAAVAIPAAGLLFLAREPLVATLYGEGYLEAVPLVAILAAVVVPLTVNMLALALLTAHDRMGAGAALYLGATALNVAMNVAWIPTFGATGAATAALVSESALALGFVVALRMRGIA